MVFVFVFQRILPLDVPNYPAFAFTGVLVWSWFQTSLLAAAGSITDNRHLLTRPGFPVAVLPPTTVATNLVHFLLALPILLGFLVLGDGGLSRAAMLLPLLIAVQFAFTVGLAFIVASAQVTFRDTQHLLTVVLLLLFYLTPVFYQADAVPESYRSLYRLNPMVHLLAAYREVLLRGEAPAASLLFALVIAAAVSVSVGYAYFVRASAGFIEEL